MDVSGCVSDVPTRVSYLNKFECLFFGCKKLLNTPRRDYGCCLKISKNTV